MVKKKKNKLCRKCLRNFEKLVVCDNCLELIAEDIAKEVSSGVWEGITNYLIGGFFITLFAGALIGYLI